MILYGVLVWFSPLTLSVVFVLTADEHSGEALRPGTPLSLCSALRSCVHHTPRAAGGDRLALLEVCSVFVF